MVDGERRKCSGGVSHENCYVSISTYSFIIVVEGMRWIFHDVYLSRLANHQMLVRLLQTICGDRKRSVNVRTWSGRRNNWKMVSLIFGDKMRVFGHGMKRFKRPLYGSSSYLSFPLELQFGSGSVHRSKHQMPYRLYHRVRRRSQVQHPLTIAGADAVQRIIRNSGTSSAGGIAACAVFASIEREA